MLRKWWSVAFAMLLTLTGMVISPMAAHADTAEAQWEYQLPDSANGGYFQYQPTAYPGGMVYAGCQVAGNANNPGLVYFGPSSNVPMATVPAGEGLLTCTMTGGVAVDAGGVVYSGDAYGLYMPIKKMDRWPGKRHCPHSVVVATLSCRAMCSLEPMATSTLS